MRIPAACAACVLVAASAADADFKRLYPDAATASSYLQNDWNKFTENYHPHYALDDDPKTAWVEGADGDGVGQKLALAISPLSSARAIRLELRSGYHKSKGLFDANATPEEVRVSLITDGGDTVVSQVFTLPKKLDWQQVELAVPANKGFAGVELEIVSVHPGTKYKDTCISDVRVFVDSDVPYNAKVEEAKRDAIRAWIKDRVAAAKYFKSLPKQYPFAATHFEAKEEWTQEENRFENPDAESPKEVKGFARVSDLLAKNEFHAPLKKLFDEQERQQVTELLSIAKSGGASVGAQWNKVAVKSRLKLPDGFELFNGLEDCADFLDRSSFALFEASAATDKSRAPRSLQTYMDLVREWSTSNVRVAYADPASTPVAEKTPLKVAEKRISKLYFWNHSVVEERGVYETKRHFVIRYDEAERPAQVAVLTEGSGSWGVELYTFEHDDKGRIREIVHKAAGFYDGEEGGEAYQSNTYRFHRLAPSA